MKLSVTDGGTTTNNYTLDTGIGWPRVVVSYQSENVVELEETRELLSQWGCHPWDGRQVRAGKDWISQWLAMANSGDTALFVFLISRVCCATSPVVVPPGQTLGLIATPARRILTLYWRDCGGAQAEFPAFRSMPRRVQPRDV